MSEVDFQIESVPVKSVVENKYNPNEVSEATFSVLKESIRKLGFVAPICVRRDRKKFVIVDGAHRFRAYCEVFPDRKNIPVVLSDCDDKVAMLRTLSLNNVHGSDDALKLAKVIGDLQKQHKMTFQEIERLTGYATKKLESLVVTAKVPKVKPDEVFDHDIDDDEIPMIDISFSLTKDRMKIVEEVIDLVCERAPDDLIAMEIRGWALYEVCRKYLAKKKKKG